jgi:hypothetical protein
MNLKLSAEWIAGEQYLPLQKKIDPAGDNDGGYEGI